MSDIDNALSGIYMPDITTIKHAVAIAAYEEKIVKKIMIALGLEDEIWPLLRSIKDSVGKSGRLSFAAFYEKYPAFPLWLGIRKLPYTYKTSVQDLFNKFEKTLIFTAWQDTFDTRPDINKWVGLVFEWPGVKGKQMIIHDSDVNLSSAGHAVLTYTTKVKIDGIQAYRLLQVEQFDTILDAIVKIREGYVWDSQFS